MFKHDLQNNKNRSGAQSLDLPWFGVNYNRSENEDAVDLSQLQAFSATTQPSDSTNDEGEREIKLALTMIGGHVVELSVHQGGYGWFLAAINNLNSGNKKSTNTDPGDLDNQT